MNSPVTLISSATTNQICRWEVVTGLSWIYNSALASNAGNNHTVCRIRMRIINSNKTLGIIKMNLLCIRTLILTTIANAHSTLLSAANTSLPIPNPIGSVTPGALNFSHASIKLMAHTKPIHVNKQATATGCSTVVFIKVVLKSDYDNIQSWKETSWPFCLLAI